MIFEKLRIHGFTAAQQQAILAGIFSGEPVLLIGPPGTAKTEVVNALGSALREDSKRCNPDGNNLFEYQIYDASKVNFEDLFGIPSIKDLTADPPKVAYIKSPSSIWGKHMIAFDELNRCSEDRQSNLFEIIRSRKLHGIPTGNLFILSTINPFGDTGTVQMSDALVDRHMLFIKINRFHDMSSSDRKQVISRVGNVEGLGFAYWGSDVSDFTVNDSVDPNKKQVYNKYLADVGQELRTIFSNAARYKKELNKVLAPALVETIDKVVDAMRQEFAKDTINVQTETSISGRRASSICRAILAVRSIQMATKQEDKELDEIMGTIINTIKLSLPIGIGGKIDQNVIDRANKTVETTVKAIWPSLKVGKTVVDIDAINEIVSTRNPLRILNGLLSQKLNEITKKTAFGHLLDKTRYEDNNKQFTQQSQEDFDRMQVLLYTLQQELPDFIPSHIKLSVTPELIEKLRAKVKMESANPNIIDYQIFIEALMASVQKKPLIYFAAKTALMYHWPRVNTHEEIIACLVDMKLLCESIEKRIELHASAKQTSTKNPTT